MRPRWGRLFEPQYLAAVAGTLAVTGLLVANRRRRPGMLACWVAYLAILAPVSGVVTTGMQVAADRYGYLTMMAFTAPMAIGLADLAGRFARFPRAGIVPKLGGLAVVGILVALTFGQCRTWRDSEALWANGIEHGAGHVADLHNNLGAVWASKGHYDLAIFAFGEALRLKPQLQAARDNMNKALANRAKLSAGARGRPKPT